MATRSSAWVMMALVVALMGFSPWDPLSIAPRRAAVQYVTQCNGVARWGIGVYDRGTPGKNPMKFAALTLAFIAGTILAGQLLGRSMAGLVDENRSQQCQAGIVTKCDK
jgi:hypothetical protein